MALFRQALSYFILSPATPPQGVVCVFGLHSANGMQGSASFRHSRSDLNSFGLCVRFLAGDIELLRGAVCLWIGS